MAKKINFGLKNDKNQPQNRENYFLTLLRFEPRPLTVKSLISKIILKKDWQNFNLNISQPKITNSITLKKESTRSNLCYLHPLKRKHEITSNLM
jgi:hypothetical protein